MTYFKLIVGFECGVNKSICQLGYPDHCFECLSKKFSDANMIIDLLEVIEQPSQEKRKEILYKHIWMKYQDILNIRHLIILTKAGIPAFNMAISDLPINATLLCGFIQANISFSSEELTIIDKINPDKKFYEFEYKNFHLLLCNGKLCRICLILDKQASNNLRDLLLNFTNFVEDNYEDKIKEFEEFSDLSILEPVRNLVIKAFEITMIYPLTFFSKIPPNITENFTLIQKAIYECAKDLLKEDAYFFVSTLLGETSKLLGIISDEEILWNIYQMMRKNIIIWDKLELQKQKLELNTQDIQEREYFIQNIMETRDLEDIIFECQEMSLEDVYIKINSSLKKAEIAVKNAAYQEALSEYQKALNYAKEFNLETEVSEISIKISEIIRLNKEVELNFAIEQAHKAEKKKDYIIALKYLFQIKEKLSNENEENKHEKELEKIHNRINKIQHQIK